MSRNRQPFYAVRVVIRDTDGQTFTRDYVRDQWHIGRDRFDSFALGDFIRTLGQVAFSDLSVIEIAPATVQENRQYHHTSH